MRKLLCVLLVAMMSLGCATDMVVTSGIVAEGKKQEAEEAEKQKQEILNKLQEQRDLQEQRKQDALDQ